MATSIPKGACAPEAFRFTVTAGSSGVSLATVSAASLRVRRNNGEETTWTATIESQSASSLVLVHAFDAAGAETATVGTYSAQALLTVPGGQRRSRSAPFQITET